MWLRSLILIVVLGVGTRATAQIVSTPALSTTTPPARVGTSPSTTTPTAPQSSGSASEQIVSLDEGVRAPFSGMLFPMETAVSWRNRISLLEERLVLDVRRCEDTAQLRLQLSSDVLSAERERAVQDVSSLRAAVEQLQTQLAAAQHREWYEAPALWFGVGVVVTVVATVALAVAVH